MDESKIAESTNSDALLHLRAHRILLARRINEIARRMVDLRTELETLDEEIKAKAHEREEVDRGIRALGPGVPPAQPKDTVEKALLGLHNQEIRP
jgi:predicted  nucleic acid-binding Zn-ribbon protein